MKNTDTDFGYTVLDFADGLEAYLFVEHEMIPNVVDSDLKPADIDEGMRRVLVAGRIIAAYSPRSRVGESVTTTADELISVTQALQIFESKIKCSIDDLIEPLGAIVKIVKEDKLDLLINEMNK